jgi:glyoxylase-like metal-dependent hydrolase (beta-lactamase superfamily II)
MTRFDPAHVSPGGPPYRYRGGPLEVTKLSVGPYDNNAYLLADRDAGEALLVDAANQADRLLELLEGLDGARLTGVVTTHRHPDHSVALAAVLAATGAWSGAHPADAGALPVAPDRALEHGDRCTLGRHEVTVLHTPGHTPGSICLLLPGDHLLSGDALFPGGVGKTSGREAFAQAITSVERHVLTLPGHTRISPGHGDDTSVAAEAPQLDGWKARGW